MIKWIKDREIEVWIIVGIILILTIWFLDVLHTSLIRTEFSEKCVENGGIPVNNGEVMVCWTKEQK